MNDTSRQLVQIAELTGSELRERARALLPRGHGAAPAIYRAALRQGRFEPETHQLASAVSAAWREHFALSLPEVVKVNVEREGVSAANLAKGWAPDGFAGGDPTITAKAVLRLRDGLECECVLLPMGHGRSTLCVSSQVGCKMGCRFCETAKMGLLRNLHAHEIVGQLLVARHVLGWPVRNLVFMGMGEALDNFEAVSTALRVLTDPAGLSLSQERLTLCSVGHVEGIRRLAQQGWKRLNLSISLNAPEDALRADLMPIGRKTSLSELQAALIEYRPRRNFVLAVNYCLLPGMNDSHEHARGVASFCAPLERVMVNVIPYNPGSEPLTSAPSEPEIERFIGWLRDEGLPVRRRVTKGRSVMAACGQLGNVQLRAKRRTAAREHTEPRTA